MNFALLKGLEFEMHLQCSAGIPPWLDVSRQSPAPECGWRTQRAATTEELFTIGSHPMWFRTRGEEGDRLRKFG